MRAAGAIAHVWRLVRKEVFKTAGFRVREAEARGSCRRVDADRDDARRAVEGRLEILELSESDQSVCETPGFAEGLARRFRASNYTRRG